MRLALAQMNSVVGDLDGNAAAIVAQLAEARDAGADLVIFPELAVTGYPPEDLLLRPAFIRAARRAGRASSPAATHGDRRARRRAAPRRRPLQRLLRARRRRDPRRLPQALPAELRRLRREPLLRARATTCCCCGSATWSRASTICEDIWQPGPADDRPRPRGRAARRQHLRLAVPRRQGPRARGDAPRPGARQLVLRRATATWSAGRTS